MAINPYLPAEDVVKTVEKMFSGDGIDADDIRHALMAERRRCADVALEYLKDLAGCDLRDDEPELLAARIMCGSK